MIYKIDDLKYYLADNLVGVLNQIKKQVTKKDRDFCFVIDGDEGSGKSVFTMQLAKYLDNTFSIDDICMTSEEFKKRIETSDKHKAIVFDEAYHGLSSRQSLSAINKLLVSKMMMMRQKNLFVFIVLPSFFLLDRYVSLFRSKLLFHIYTNKDRHYWLGFNRKNKKILYLTGRKTMSYTYPRINQLRGHFYGKYTIDEEKYREKKMKALEQTEFIEEESRFQQQRNILVADFVKRNEFSYVKAVKELETLGFKESLALKEDAIRLICIAIAKKRENEKRSII